MDRRNRFSNVSSFNEALTNHVINDIWKIRYSFCEIFKNQVFTSVIIFWTYFISSICFPSLIVYKPLPGKRFEDLYTSKDDIQYRCVDVHNAVNTDAIGWLGVINVGTFLVFQGLGTLFRAESAKSHENIFTKSERFIGVWSIPIVL